jgi:hypothetical protein
MSSKSTRRRSTTQNDIRPMMANAVQAADTAPVSAPLAGTTALPPTVPDMAATRGL